MQTDLSMPNAKKRQVSLAADTEMLLNIRSRLTDDLHAVDALILRQLQSDIEVINQIGQHLIKSGGKRLRPLLVLLSAKAFGYEGVGHIDLAAIIEFIHTATLLHDDVVDASNLRRGRETANTIWGNPASVLVGDFLYSRSFQLMTRLDDMRVLEVLANATNTIAEGEVLQLVNCNNPLTTEAHYLQIIRHKTAALFEASAQLGPMIVGCSDETIRAMATFGLHLGTAYQLIDDVLDYAQSAKTTGKNRGDDLAEGKPTLPLIYAMQRGKPSETKLIEQSIQQGGLQNLETILQIIHDTKALDYTKQKATEQIQLALQALDKAENLTQKETLHSLATFVIERSH